jgi:hypothetical protein
MRTTLDSEFRMRSRIVLVALLTMLGSGSAHAQVPLDALEIVGTIAPLDEQGRIELEGKKYRLHGARLPEGICRISEAAAPCAQIALAGLNALITKGETHWRNLGDSFDSNLIGELIDAGWLQEDTNTSGGQYREREVSARAARRGVWALLRS